MGACATSTQVVAVVNRPYGKRERLRRRRTMAHVRRILRESTWQQQAELNALIGAVRSASEDEYRGNDGVGLFQQLPTRWAR